MRYGHFDDGEREYVIERPDTPLPWINYLGTRDYLATISNTGGGSAFYRDPRLRRILRYRYNAAPTDVGGRFLYLRDDESGAAWCPTWQPMRRPLEHYACHHGLSTTRIEGTSAGIETTVTYFVPPEETLEVWRVVLRNTRAEPARLSLFGAVEFCLWDAQDDATNFQRNYSIGEVEVDDGVVYHRSEYRERRNHFAYFATSAPVAGFDTDRDAFCGPYRGFADPRALEEGACRQSVAHGWAPIGALHSRHELAPGEERTVVFLLGYFENPPEHKFDPPDSDTLAKNAVREVIARWRDPAQVGAALDALAASWDDTLSTLRVATPDTDTDRMVNIWTPYQCMVTFNLSRSMSSFESGIGRGMGFRDSSQDVLGFVHLAPRRARARLLDLAATQLQTGGAYHQYQPLTKRGNDAIGSGFNDDPLWLVLAVAAYLKETGDTAILDERVAYDNAAGTEAPLYEHLERCIAYTVARRGPHGLPLIGRADWNDCLNLNCFSLTPGEPFQTTENRSGGAAESVFIAGQFVLAAGEMAEIAALCGDEAAAKDYRAVRDEMAGAVERHGWDGAWFRRAYDYAGAPVGSAVNDEGQIYLEPQGMCVMAGIGLADGRAAAALASAGERLGTEHGLMLVAPPYRRYHPELGEISSYPPGYKENGSVFCHVNPWVMIAAARLGDGAAAFDYYRRTNPSAREQRSDVHRCEPYVYAQTIAGRDAPTCGEAKNSWLTGSAAWHLVAVTQWILGIRPEHAGLRIDPVLPADWPGFRATRRFRGATYSITVTNPDRSPGRVRRLVVDGVPQEGTCIAPAPAGETVHVEAVIEPLPSR